MKTLARERDKAEILRRLGTVGPERRPRWGRMSAHQMVCHLADSLRMATGRKPVASISGPLRRTVLKWIVLHAPLRWPAGIRTCPELDQELGGTRPVEFGADVAQVRALLDELTASPRAEGRPDHPLFGRMSDADWLRWGYRHLDHHLRQFGA